MPGSGRPKWPRAPHSRGEGGSPPVSASVRQRSTSVPQRATISDRVSASAPHVSVNAPHAPRASCTSFTGGIGAATRPSGWRGETEKISPGRGNGQSETGNMQNARPSNMEKRAPWYRPDCVLRSSYSPRKCSDLYLDDVCSPEETDSASQSSCIPRKCPDVPIPRTCSNASCGCLNPLVVRGSVLTWPSKSVCAKG